VQPTCEAARLGVFTTHFQTSEFPIGGIGLLSSGVTAAWPDTRHSEHPVHDHTEIAVAAICECAVQAVPGVPIGQGDGDDAVECGSVLPLHVVRPRLARRNGIHTVASGASA
jgi:hypothetical protein